MGKKFNILIVDDVIQNIQLVGSLLKDKYNISYATSGKQALRAVENKDYDLILLDVMMPEMDGYEVCKILKSNPKTKDIPLMFLTAKNDVESSIKGYEFGADDFISKPFNSLELLARVKNRLEVKASRDKLIESERQLKIANATKDKFFSIIAHDLKNPFTTLISLTEILSNNYLELDEADLKNIYDQLHLASTKTYKLLENLLTWARAQLNKIEVEKQKIHLYDLVNYAIDSINMQSSAKNIYIENKVGHVVLNTDFNIVSTILINLLSNAVKFSHKNGVIEVISNIKNQDVVISIKDNGIGISKENLAKLFSIEHKFSTKGTDDEIGTGLGLILCQEFVEKLGGKIWVESVLDKGSIFTFTLPLES